MSGVTSDMRKFLIAMTVIAFVVAALIGGVIMFEQVIDKETSTMTVVDVSDDNVRFKESAMVFNCTGSVHEECSLIEPGDKIKVTYGPKRGYVKDTMYITELVLPTG